MSPSISSLILLAKEDGDLVWVLPQICLRLLSQGSEMLTTFLILQSHLKNVSSRPLHLILVSGYFYLYIISVLSHSSLFFITVFFTKLLPIIPSPTPLFSVYSTVEILKRPWKAMNRMKTSYNVRRRRQTRHCEALKEITWESFIWYKERKGKERV